MSLLTSAPTKLCNHVLQRLAHLNGILNGLKNLFAQRGGASVPEERRFPREIEKWHRVARSIFTLGSFAPSASVAESFLRIVTRGARLRAVYGKRLIKKEAASQLHAWFGKWIVERQGGLRKRAGERETKGRRIRGHFAVAVCGPRPGGVEVVWHVTVEAEGLPKPVCVAEWVLRLMTGSST